MSNPDLYTLAQNTVIGSMLIDEGCVPLVMSKLTEDDFVDQTCRNFFRAIRELMMEGRPVDLVPIMGKLRDQGDYVRFARKLMEGTPTAANVASYIPEVLNGAMMRRFWGLCNQGIQCIDPEDAERLTRKMASVFSATDRMPRMTGPQLAADFKERMRRTTREVAAMLCNWQGHVIRWLCDGVLYGLLEIVWRGHTHWTMMVLAASICIPLDIANERFPWELPLWVQAILGGLVITAGELLAGLVLNLWLGLAIWDYTGLWGNFLGQICPLYTALWCLLAGPVIVGFDWLDYWLCGGERPRYILI